MADEELTTWTVIAETKEWVGPITMELTIEGATVATTDFTVCVVPKGDRPTGWVPPETIEAGQGVLVGAGTAFPLDPNRSYAIFARHAAVLEEPVVPVGYVKAK